MIYYLSFAAVVGVILSGRLVIIGEGADHIFGTDAAGLPIVTVNQACQVRGVERIRDQMSFQ